MDRAVLTQLQTISRLPGCAVSSRWHGENQARLQQSFFLHFKLTCPSIAARVNPSHLRGAEEQISDQGAPLRGFGFQQTSWRKSMRFFRFHTSTLLIGAVLGLVVSTPLLQQAGYAQASTAAGAIQGTVTDPSGAVVPNAKVIITEPAKGFQKVLKTSNSGFYSSGAVEPGKYIVHVEAAGFSQASLELLVQVGQASNGDLKLGVAGTVTQVTVEDSAVSVDTSGSAGRGSVEPPGNRNAAFEWKKLPGYGAASARCADPGRHQL